MPLTRMPVPRDFHFISAVCSHGFFMLAPNAWDPVRRELFTVITLDGEQAAPVSVVARPDAGIGLRLPRGLPATAVRQVRAGVARMLRLDEDFTDFHRLCRRSATHQAATELRFGRLLRSPSLFEDMVKVICTCNIGWSQTVAMTERLVRLWGVPSEGWYGSRRRPTRVGRSEPGEPLKRPPPPAEIGSSQPSAAPAAMPSKGFPTPIRLARAGAAALRRQGRLGYRAAFVHRLAREVADGRRDLDAIERFDGPSHELFLRLRDIRGVGDYAAAHLCMLLGRYDRLAIDSELLRHLRQQIPERCWSPSAIHEHYEPWRPYQFLAYWFELWSGYSQRHGSPEGWSPGIQGRAITSKAAAPPGYSGRR